MPRATNGPATKNRRKAILKQAKGYYSGRRKLFKNAKETVQRAMRYSYRDRRVRKREFRCLWITRINAASRSYGLPYNHLMSGLKAAGVTVDRKVLADLAVYDIAAFGQIVETARQALAAAAPSAA